MADIKRELQDLKTQLLAMKKESDSLRTELAENKGNLAAYESEREKLFQRAKEKNSDPKNIGRDIETRKNTLAVEVEAAKRKLDAIKTSSGDSEEGW